MDSVINAIRPYDVLNSLIPGGVACYFIGFSEYKMFLPENGVMLIVFIYVIGSVISRIGSFLESCLKIICARGWYCCVVKNFSRIPFLEYVPYGQYLEAVRKRSEITRLVEINNYYRSMMSCGIVSMTISESDLFLLCFAMFIVFFVSYVKQTKYVVKAVRSELAL